MSQSTAENTGASVEQTETKAKAPAKKASGGLASLKLAQLQELASQLGITGARRLRKADLVAKIQDHQRGGAVADREAAKKKDEAQKAQNDAQSQARKGAQKKDADKAPADKAGAAEDDSASAKSSDATDKTADAADESSRSGRGRRRRSSSAAAGAPSKNDQHAGEESSAHADDKNRDENKNNSDKNHSDDTNRGGKHESDKHRGDKNNAEKKHSDKNSAEKNNGENDRSENESGEDSSEDSHNEGGRNRRETRNQRNRRNRRGRDRDHNDSNEDSHEDSDDRGSRNQRNRRNRNRDNNNDDSRGNRRERQRNNRRNRGRNQIEVEDTELTEDDVLAPVAGILDVMDNYAFIRTSGYLPGPNDVYVTMKQVRQYNLRKGDAVVGAIRAPREDENNNHSNNGKRNRYTPLIKLATVNGLPADENKDRVNFNKLVPLYPEERLRLEAGAKSVGPRIIDLVAPIGKGQRGLIVSPPKAGKTMILQSIADSIKKNNPEVHLMMVLVDERPEEVTDMQRTVDGEVIASTFDRPAEDHTTVAELAIERAKRLVEQGRDVVVLLDSMTRLGRAYNQAAPASGRILSGGVDAAALYPPKRFFGAARNIENGGSLTILATALVETGSKMDEVIFEEFKGTGNMELRLSRSLAEKRIFPAVDVNASSTRREENLLSPEELKIMWRLRRVLSSLEPQQALELLTTKIKETESNAEFLMVVNRTTLDGK